MMVAKYAEISDKGEIISHLPATIQYRIAAPSVPEPVRDQILNSFAKGQRLKVYEVNQLIRAATGKPPQHVREGGAVGPAGSKSAVPEERLGMVGEGELHPPSATPVDSPTEETVESGTASKPAAPSSSMISLNRLLTTTKDPEKQDHIKKIYAIVRQLSQPTRGNLISHLAKLGDLSAAKLADCLL